MQPTHKVKTYIEQSHTNVQHRGSRQTSINYYKGCRKTPTGYLQQSR